MCNTQVVAILTTKQKLKLWRAGMPNQTGEEVSYREIGSSQEQSFFDRSAGVRLLIGLTFTLSLFYFLHFREVRLEILEPDTQASKFYVAQIDFDFFDEEATLMMRQEAVRDLGRIYKVPDKEIRQARVEFEEFLAKDSTWREKYDYSAIEEVYKTLDDLQRGLQRLRFTDPRTLQKAQEVGMSIVDYQIFTPASLDQSYHLPHPVFSRMQTRIAQEDPRIPGDILSFVIESFREKKWKLDVDSYLSGKVRKKVAAGIPDKYTHVNAGDRILDQGEKVTSRHMVMFQAMKKALGDSRNLLHPITLLGSFILALSGTGICVAFLRLQEPDILCSNRKLFLLVTVFVVTLALSKVFEHMLLSASSNLFEVFRYPLFAPFAAILVCNLLGPGMGTFMGILVSITISMTLAFDRNGLMVTNLAAALMAIVSTHTMVRRKEVFIVCMKAWLVCAIVILSVHLYAHGEWSNSILLDLGSTAFFMLLTAVLVVGLLPLLESAFDIMTNVSLMEYMDPNHVLLRRLTIEAPGTYQHSVIVGSLAEAAATAIGARGLFCRISTLYHDVGKMATPQYFTENQNSEMNIHKLLTPKESAQVIIAHVAEGVALARKAGLPEPFISIIKEHHGTTLVYYFYRKQLEMMGGEEDLVEKNLFRYQGPKPRSKESAIIMLADSFEAASRSLDEVDEVSLTELMNAIARYKAEDGQFDESPLTFEELKIVKEVMVKTLLAIGHTRIKYPEMPKVSSEQQMAEA